jgi:hypothetical protein
MESSAGAIPAIPLRTDQIVTPAIPRLSGLYHGAVRRFCRVTFPFFERLGFHAVPIHYYQPIPDTRKLSPSLAHRTSRLVGIDFDEGKQLELLSSFQRKFKSEYDALPNGSSDGPTRFSFENTSFGTVDAEILYCMIREFHPRTVIEVGAGQSTLVSARSISENRRRGESDARLISIEPYPAPFLNGTIEGLTELIRAEVQSLPIEFFGTLEANDILFIDSTHVIRIDGDVNYEILEILPRLKPGVVVHIHDIFLPYEYDLGQMHQHKTFLTEQYLLQAFLSFNPRFEILWGSYCMHRRHPDALGQAFRSYAEKPAPAYSWWMRVRT